MIIRYLTVGSSKKANIYKIQTFQSILLQMITCVFSTLCFKSRLTFRLKIHTVLKVAKIFYTLFRARLTNHSNLLILTLNSDYIPGNPSRKLKRNWNCDLKLHQPSLVSKCSRWAITSSCQSSLYIGIIILEILKHLFIDCMYKKMSSFY